jgi:hypothetical protein
VPADTCRPALRDNTQTGLMMPRAIKSPMMRSVVGVFISGVPAVVFLRKSLYLVQLNSIGIFDEDR